MTWVRWKIRFELRVKMHKFKPRASKQTQENGKWVWNKDESLKPFHVLIWNQYSLKSIFKPVWPERDARRMLPQCTEAMNSPVGLKIYKLFPRSETTIIRSLPNKNLHNVQMAWFGSSKMPNLRAPWKWAQQELQNELIIMAPPEFFGIFFLQPNPSHLNIVIWHWISLRLLFIYFNAIFQALPTTLLK